MRLQRRRVLRHFVVQSFAIGGFWNSAGEKQLSAALDRLAAGDRDRETLKYRCPARYAGITCKGMEQRPVSDAVRIRLAEDRRVFTPVARSSYR